MKKRSTQEIEKNINVNVNGLKAVHNLKKY